MDSGIPLHVFGEKPETIHDSFPSMTVPGIGEEKVNKCEKENDKK
jgi:hypothetical protein